MRHQVAMFTAGLVCFACLAVAPWYGHADDEMEGAACVPSANCGNCLVGKVNDTTCTSGFRCSVYQCTGGNTANFKFCVRSTSGGPCYRAGTLNVTCTGCTTWTGSCVTNKDCGRIGSPNCGDDGGNGPTTSNLTQTCR